MPGPQFWGEEGRGNPDRLAFGELRLDGFTVEIIMQERGAIWMQTASLRMPLSGIGYALEIHRRNPDDYLRDITLSKTFAQNELNYGATTLDILLTDGTLVTYDVHIPAPTVPPPPRPPFVPPVGTDLIQYGIRIAFPVRAKLIRKRRVRLRPSPPAPKPVPVRVAFPVESRLLRDISVRFEAQRLPATRVIEARLRSQALLLASIEDSD